MRVLFVLVIGLAFFGCSYQSPEEAPVVAEESLLDVQPETAAAKDDFRSFVMIPVSNHFDDLVDFIEKNGTIVSAQGVPCDYQYTFFDSHGHRHALITIKRNQDGKPDLKGRVIQISVWAYYGGQKNQDNFFGYIIHRDFIAAMSNQAKDLEAIEFAYYDFIKKVI